jgi:hypothetical protein
LPSRVARERREEFEACQRGAAEAGDPEARPSTGSGLHRKREYMRRVAIPTQLWPARCATADGGPSPFACSILDNNFSLDKAADELPERCGATVLSRLPPDFSDDALRRVGHYRKRRAMSARGRVDGSRHHRPGWPIRRGLPPCSDGATRLDSTPPWFGILGSSVPGQRSRRKGRSGPAAVRK